MKIFRTLDAHLQRACYISPPEKTKLLSSNSFTKLAENTLHMSYNSKRLTQSTAGMSYNGNRLTESYFCMSYNQKWLAISTFCMSYNQKRIKCSDCLKEILISFHLLSTSPSYHQRARLISIITDLAAMLQFW
jgi:hypothetical protein